MSQLDEKEWGLEEDLATRIGSKSIGWREFLYRLAFTRHDSMDLLQLFLLVQIGSFNVAFFLAGLGIMKVTIAAWSTFGTIFGLLAILGASTWRGAQAVAQSKMPGEIGAAISKSPMEPNIWKDDERGDFTEREAV